MSGDPAAGGDLARRLASARGRAEVVRELFLLHRERVLGLCLHVTGQRAEAEDALQDAFLSVHRGLPGFRGEASLSTWLYRIALRAALSVRARRRPAGQVPEALVDGAPGPDRAAEGRLEAARLARALDRLGAEHRTILALFAVEGLRHAEIAEVLGVPEGTVWSRLHGARRALARELDEGAGGRGPNG